MLWILLAQAVPVRSGALDQITSNFQTIAQSWSLTLHSYARWLFAILVLFSLTWTLGQQVIKKGDLTDLIAEFVRFLLFAGFFYWLLDSGPTIAISIINSMNQIASELTGTRAATSASGFIDLAFDILKKITDSIGWDAGFSASLSGIILGGIITVLVALVALNYAIILCSAWCLMYAGIFYLGFGGARWTSDMALNYYRSILSIAIQLFTITLIIGIGKSIIDFYHSHLASETISFSSITYFLLIAIIVYVLSSRLPNMISGIITGASIGNTGIGTMTAGAIMGAGMTAAALSKRPAKNVGITAGGALLLAGASTVGTLKAGKQAAANVVAGKDSLAHLGGGPSEKGFKAAATRTLRTTLETGKLALGSAKTAASSAVSSAASSAKKRIFS